jgi:hypothetical protein
MTAVSFVLSLEIQLTLVLLFISCNFGSFFISIQFSSPSSRFVRHTASEILSSEYLILATRIRLKGAKWAWKRRVIAL